MIVVVALVKSFSSAMIALALCEKACHSRIPNSQPNHPQNILNLSAADVKVEKNTQGLFNAFY